MRKDIWKDGINTRFSKDNQPANEKKRKPKIGTIIKQLLNENENLKKMIDAMMEQAKKGNVLAFEKLIDRAYGKVTDKKVNLNVEKTNDEAIKEMIDELLDD